MPNELNASQPSGCGSCGYSALCGGADGQQSIGGCFSSCGTSCRVGRRCDWVCPVKSDFVDHVREVGGLRRRATGALVAPTFALPSYVPMVRHRSSRVVEFSGGIVALSLEDIAEAIRHKETPVNDPHALRSFFGIRPDATVIIVSVARDRVLERYWARRVKDGTVDTLAALGTSAMTVPNFSLFQDAPRTHTLWNLRRMAVVADELSSVGVPVVPHLNACQRADWDYWHSYLREQATIQFIAKEFQTGLRRRELGEQAIRDLANLQHRLGRELRPIIVGGVGYAATIARYFDRAVFVDSQPFMKTVNRQRRAQTGAWNTHLMAGPIDELLEHNVRTHARYVDEELARGRARAAARPRRLGRSQGAQASIDCPLTQPTSRQAVLPIIS